MPHSERHVQIPNVVSIHATDPRLIFKSFAGSLSTCPSYISNFDQHILHRTLLYLQRKPALRCRRSSASVGFVEVSKVGVSPTIPTVRP